MFTSNGSVRWKIVYSIKQKWRRLRKKAAKNDSRTIGCSLGGDSWIKERNADGEKVWARKDNPNIEIVRRGNRFDLDCYGEPVFSCNKVYAP